MARNFSHWLFYSTLSVFHSQHVSVILELIHASGFAISPIQQIFLTTETVKTPAFPQTVYNIVDLSEKISTGQCPLCVDYNLITILTRSAIESTSLDEPQSQLWQRNSSSCTVMADGGTGLLGETDGMILSCTQGGSPLTNMTALEDPFLAQLNANFSTGLIRQFIPRLNSTATVQEVDDSQWPQDCDRKPGALFKTYEYINASVNATGSWSITGCMPADQTKSPWQATRRRQDFTEELYLNITLNGFLDVADNYTSRSTYKVVLDTTAGYFELPNYMNGQTAGPLLEDDPNDHCDHECAAQGMYETYIS